MVSHDSRNLSLKTNKLPQKAGSLAVLIACVIIAGLLYFYSLAQKQAQQELFAQQVAQRQNEASETYKIGDTVQLTGLDQEEGNPVETSFGADLPWVGTIEVTVTDVILCHSIDEAGFTSGALNDSLTPENADSLYLVYTLHFKNIDAVQKHTPMVRTIYYLLVTQLMLRGIIFSCPKLHLKMLKLTIRILIKLKGIFGLMQGMNVTSNLLLRYLQKN